MAKLTKPHVALLASPGLGHLIPVVELAKRLIAQHGFSVTVFTVTTSARGAEDKVLEAATSLWPGLFNAVVLPTVVDVSSELEPNASILSRMLAWVRTALPSLRSLISDMKFKPNALIVDQFGTEAIKGVAEEFDMVKYVFIASNAWFLSYNLYIPYVNKRVDGNEAFHIPGCDSIPGCDLLDLTFDPTRRAYWDFVRIGREITEADGVLVNTWQDIEGRTLDSFKDDRSMKPIVKVPVYPIGPVIRMPKQILRNELIEWLDCQPDESVVFVSFGSGGTLSTQQTIELAWGLELSKQRFIWVIKPPIENDVAASLFKSVHNVEELVKKCLPDGFFERTRDVGIVISKWVSQEEILAHRSIGGFVSHCGWNSVLESIVNGVPIIAWPLYAEQNMNATMLVERIGIAVRSKVKPSKELVKREEIAEMVRIVMVENEGLGIRKRIKELKMSAREALSEGGSSYSALSKVAKDCEMKFLSKTNNVIE